MDNAERVMEDHIREAIQVDGAQLVMEYSHHTPQSLREGGAGNLASGAHDWVCPMCQGINFFRCVHVCVWLTGWLAGWLAM